MVRKVALLVPLLALLVAGCSRKEAQPAQTTPAQKWTVKGSLVNVNAEQKQVTLDHQDIPGLMSGMTMSFRVEDPSILTGFSGGDAVEFDLEQTSAGLTVTGLRKIDAGQLAEGPATTYKGKGTVVLVNRKVGAVLLKHEGAGALPPGELVLPVVPPSQLEGLQDDTPVEFTLEMRKDQLVVSKLKQLPKK